LTDIITFIRVINCKRYVPWTNFQTCIFNKIRWNRYYAESNCVFNWFTISQKKNVYLFYQNIYLRRTPKTCTKARRRPIKWLLTSTKKIYPHQFFLNPNDNQSWTLSRYLVHIYSGTRQTALGWYRQGPYFSFY